MPSSLLCVLLPTLLTLSFVFAIPRSTRPSLFVTLFPHALLLYLLSTLSVWIGLSPSPHSDALTFSFRNTSRLSSFARAYPRRCSLYLTNFCSYYYRCDVVRPPCVTATANWPPLSLPRIIYWKWSSGGTILTGETEELAEKPVTVPICPPQIPQRSNPGLRNEKRETNCLSYFTHITSVPLSARTNLYCGQVLDFICYKPISFLTTLPTLYFKLKFVVQTATSTKMAVFRNEAPCSLVDTDWYFSEA
jgi:hypothetical protein